MDLVKHVYADNPYTIEFEFWVSVYPQMITKYVMVERSRNKRSEAFSHVLNIAVKMLYFPQYEIFHPNETERDQKIWLLYQKDQLDRAAHGMGEFYSLNRTECKDPLDVLRHFATKLKTQYRKDFNELIEVRKYILNPNNTNL